MSSFLGHCQTGSYQAARQFAYGESTTRKIKLCKCGAYSKKGWGKKVGNFRPISMLNASGNITCKVLANRLREILGVLIEDHQPGFLKGRSTLGSIVVREAIQFIKRNKIPGFMLKWDFEQAYDTVE